MRMRAASVIAALGFLSLVTNRLPLVPASCFALAALLTVRKPGNVALATGVVWAFWLASFLLTLESPRQLVSFEFHRRDGQIFFCMLPLVLFSGLRPDREKVTKLAAAFVVAQALIAVLGLVGHAGGWQRNLVGSVFLWDEGENPGLPNFTALYGAHNAAGSVLALGVLVAGAMAAFSEAARRRWFWGLIMIPLLWGEILSKSRGSFAAMSGGLGVLGFLALREGRVSKRALLGVALVVGITAATLGPIMARRMGQLPGERGALAWRLSLWKRAVQEWSWSPIVGEGMGRFNDKERRWSGVKGLYYVVTEAKAVNAPSHAHNSYVHFLAEGGVVGFGITVSFWAWIAWRLRGSREPLRIAAFLGVLYLLAISMTEHYMGGGAMMLVLSCLVGTAWNQPQPTPGTSIAAKDLARASTTPNATKGTATSSGASPTSTPPP